MAKTYYAWSPIKAGTVEEPLAIARGAKISARDLGISAAAFEALIDSGAVRDKPFPAPDDYEGSAIDWLRDQLAEATSSVEEASAQSEVSVLEGVK
jgi:hypothetical protein